MLWFLFALLFPFAASAQSLAPCDFASVNPVPGYVRTYCGPSLGERWAPANLTLPPTIFYDIRSYGGVCNGVVNDTTALNNAITAAAATGGQVYIPPTGFPCQISNVTVGNNVRLVGSGMFGFPGTDKTCMERAAAGGSWIRPSSTTNPGITLSGHGSGVEGINICYDQPVPGGSFTPTAYGDAIRVAADQATVKGVNIIGSTVGINLLYPSANGGGFGVVIRDILVTSFSKCFTANFVNDVAFIENFQCRNLYYASNNVVRNYLEANLIGMDLHYIDNPWIYGFECFECAVGIKFTDDTVFTSTHSLYNGQLDGIQCNLVAACLQVAAGTTVVDTQIGSLQAQTDTDAALTATLFQLASNNLNIRINNLAIRAAGGQIMTLGNGTGGKLSVNYAQILGYSQIATGQSGIVLNAGATLTKGIWDYRKTIGVSAGSLFAGTGANLAGVKSPGIRWQPFSSLAELTFTGTGAFVDLTNNNQDDPYAWGTGPLAATYLPGVQGRIVGRPQVVARNAGDTCTFKISNFSEITTAATTVPTVGSFMTVDSNWIDLSNVDNILGTVQANCPATTQLKFGDLMVMTR